MRERLPFLFIQCRPDGDIARDEKETIAQVTGLTVGDSLRTHLLLAEPNLDPVHDLDIKNNYSGLIISGSPFGAEIQRDLAKPEHLHLHARLSALVRYLLDNDFPSEVKVTSTACKSSAVKPVSAVPLAKASICKP